MSLPYAPGTTPPDDDWRVRIAREALGRAGIHDPTRAELLAVMPPLGAPDPTVTDAEARARLGAAFEPLPPPESAFGRPRIVAPRS